MSRSLTIGVDARKIRDFGIGRYLQGLLEGLASTSDRDRYVLFTAPDARGPLPESLRDKLPSERFHTVPIDAPLYSIREVLAFRGVAERHELDVLHFPHYVRALWPGCPVVVTIHDAIHLDFAPSAAAKLYARVMMSWSARTASRLLTGTEASRDDISRRVSVDPGRFTVTPYAVGADFSPPSDEIIEALRSRRSLEKPFVLVVASHRPHKNLASAVAAFRDANLTDAQVVVPTRDRDSLRQMRQVVPEAGSHPTFLTDVSDSELRALYAAAHVVLIPSLYEGFGLPALEAAACGACVLASDIPPHREVLGNAAHFAAPRATELANALRQLWNDDGLRNRLSSQGPQRAAAFTWESCARMTLAEYARVAGTDSSG